MDPQQSWLAEEHREWNRRHAAAHSANIRPHGNDREPERRLRIGPKIHSPFEFLLQAGIGGRIAGARRRCEKSCACALERAPAAPRPLGFGHYRPVPSSVLQDQWVHYLPTEHANKRVQRVSPVVAQIHGAKPSTASLAFHESHPP